MWGYLIRLLITCQEIIYLILLLFAHRQTPFTPPPTQPSSRLAIPELMPAAQRYFAKTLSLSSARSAQSCYVEFCHRFSPVPYPLNETLLCSFITFLDQEGLKHQSIKCYLSALRHAQIANGFPDPRIGLDHPQLDYILRGIKRSQASAASSHIGLPITPEILRLIYSHLPSSQDSCMI